MIIYFRHWRIFSTLFFKRRIRGIFFLFGNPVRKRRFVPLGVDKVLRRGKKLMYRWMKDVDFDRSRIRAKSTTQGWPCSEGIQCQGPLEINTKKCLNVFDPCEWHSNNDSFVSNKQINRTFLFTHLPLIMIELASFFFSTWTSLWGINECRSVIWECVPRVAGNHRVSHNNGTTSWLNCWRTPFGKILVQMNEWNGRIRNVWTIPT